MKSKNTLLVAIALLLSLPTLFFFGMLAAPGRTLTDLEKMNFQLFAQASSWISAIATFAAVAAALRIANTQAREAKERELRQQALEAVQTLHYCIALTNDLRGRLTSIKNKLCNVGQFPLAQIAITMEGMKKRYEAFYDHGLYKHLPGPIIDQIIHLSGSFAGLEAIVTMTTSQHNSKFESMIEITASSDPEVFEKTIKELRTLAASLLAERQKINI